MLTDSQCENYKHGKSKKKISVWGCNPVAKVTLTLKTVLSYLLYSPFKFRLCKPEYISKNTVFFSFNTRNTILSVLVLHVKCVSSVGPELLYQCFVFVPETTDLWRGINDLLF